MAPVRNNGAAPDKDSQPAAGSSAAGAAEKQRRKPGRVPVSCAECRRCVPNARAENRPQADIAPQAEAALRSPGPSD